MALSDIRSFLTDLLARFDSSLDVNENSRAQAELVEPILARIGGDPFDDDMETFLRTRIQQVFPNLAITEADELTDLLIDPMRILLEPITREIQLVKLRTSLRNINALADDEVDALMGNFFESRKAGGFAIGVVRIYFAAPQSATLTLINVAQGRGGLRYLVARPQAITSEQMLLNTEGSEYYFDVNLIAENRGDEYNIERSEIISISNLPAAIRVTNPRRFTGGIVRETSNEYVARVQQGASDKTLTTAPGIAAVLNDNFPDLRQVFEVGFGDPEMQRDLLCGGSLGSVPQADALGEYYGTGTPIDDLDADSTTNILQAQGNFVTRIAAVGSKPDGWYVTLVYKVGALVIQDVAVLEVLGDTQLRVDHEMPLTLASDAVTWMLRRRELTISSIPGGIAMPDTPNGFLRVPTDTVHIGGKTDIFVAGDVEAASARIIGMTDELPLARGYAAQTAGSTAQYEDIVTLTDIASGLMGRVTPGMSLVLSQGADVGAYRIVEVVVGAKQVRLDTQMTGEQPNLAWKVVDEIDIDLTEPKDILLEGSDLILSGGSPTVIVAGSINFAGAGIRSGDILFVDHPEFGGDFTITDTSATSMLIDPAAPRALSGIHYVVSRRSEGVQRPVLRVKSFELVDSTGAPNGISIPYRDPVQCVSRAFQNESTGYLYDGPVFTGLTSNALPGSVAASGLTMLWEVRDPERAYASPSASGTFTFGTGSVATLAAQFNANPQLSAQGVRAVALSYGGYTYLGVTSQKLVTLTSGSALATFGWEPGVSNAQVRGGLSFAAIKVRRGDLVEFVGGNNAGAAGRIVTEPSASNRIVLGIGPLGPPGTTALYDLRTLSPDAGGRVRIARPSIGSIRTYFLEPTSVDFSYKTTRFAVTLDGQERRYQPDPENTRIIIPPPPMPVLGTLGTTNISPQVFEDDGADFLRFGVKEGDLLDVLYVPILSAGTFDSLTPVVVRGKTLVLQIDSDPFVQVLFPYDMTPADIVSYINEQTGTSLAHYTEDRFSFYLNRRIAIIASSTALGVLTFSATSSDHAAKGTYIIQTVAQHRLTLAATTPVAGGPTAQTFYRVRRYLQRVSSTEMNLQSDASGLYYADVEAVSVLPGDYNNIRADIELTATGYRSDGYRLVASKPELSYSRAEELRAEVSRAQLLIGAADNPADFVQLNLQNVLVSYERSALVDEIQSFVSSRYRRVICEDILVRHLLPHYVSMNWRYSSGTSEPEMVRAVTAYLAQIESDEPLEVGSLVNILRGRQATSVFVADPTAPSGRTAPFLVVVKHEESRAVRASLVRDVVETSRMSTYLPDNLVLKRLSSSGVR